MYRGSSSRRSQSLVGYAPDLSRRAYAMWVVGRAGLHEQQLRSSELLKHNMAQQARNAM